MGGDVRGSDLAGAQNVAGVSSQPDAGSWRLAVVVSHPIQYYAPWFAQLAATPELQLMVFHLWDFGVAERHDPGFGQHLRWDLPLLEGYPSRFVPNVSADPGTHHFSGLDNPGLVRELLAWQPDAVLLFGYAYRSHLRLLLDPRLWRVPILLRGDSNDLARARGVSPALAALLRRLLFRRFAAALAVGQANAAYLNASGIPAWRTFRAPHAVDNARFQAAAPAAEQQARAWRAELGIDSDAPVVLFAGKFEAKKRPLDLLNAFAALHHPTAVLVLLGAGALEPELRRRAAELAPGRVRLVGFQNQAAMPRAYALGDVLVLPSHGNGETWGLALNEAMNLARPVIASSHVGGAPDLVIPGRTGWLFPAGDVAALQRCLADALADPHRLRAMGQAARDHVEQFSYSAGTAGLLEALQTVAPGPEAVSAPVVDVICPELHVREGGIQIYSRVLLRGLLEVLPKGARLRVFVRNDLPRHRPGAVNPRIELHACGSRFKPWGLLRFLGHQLAAQWRQKPVLVISTHPHFAPLQLLLARRAGCPAWTSAHGIDVWTLRPGLRLWSLRRLDRLLPVSRYTRDQLRRQLAATPERRRGGRCPELALLPNSYSARNFRAGPRPPELLQRYGLAAGQPLIFCLTRLSSQDRYKHVDNLIEAMPLLLRRFPDLRLLIGGVGDDLPRLRRLVRQRGLAEVVLLPGKIAAPELPDHYRLATVFALPSEGEGFGVVFLEAAGCGCPVLAGNRDGSVDPLEDGRFGCLVDPRLPLAPPLQALLEGCGEPLWHQPQALAAAVEERFGDAAFTRRLRRLLDAVPALAVPAGAQES